MIAVRAKVVRWIALVVVPASVAAGCGDVNGALERQAQARDLAADLRIQFTKAADAANRAVMADTDESSVAFAHESEQATGAVQKDVDLLGPILGDLKFEEEARILQEFVTRFAAYEELDHRILDLAVENTNLKAQRLSFGPAADAADALRNALAAAAPSDAGTGNWHAQALALTAVESVREIQVLQARHIADADDAAMTGLEKQMATSEAAARRAIAAMGPLVPTSSRSHLSTATAALDQFMGVNSQILALSRRNTNVRSLALSLDEKRPLTTACDDSLQRLQDALAKRHTVGTGFMR